MKEKIQKLFRYEVGSIVMILFGLFLLLNPDFGSAAIATILSWVLIICGAVGALIGVLNWPTLGFSGIIGSAVAVIAGIYLRHNPLMLAGLLGILLGILLASQGFGALRDALRIKRGGGSFLPGLILGIVMLALGIYLILCPLATTRFVWTIAGIAMIVCGVANLIAHYKASKYIPGKNNTVIDADD